MTVFLRVYVGVNVVYGCSNHNWRTFETNYSFSWKLAAWR